MSDREYKYTPCKRVRIKGKKERVSHLVLINAGFAIGPDEVVHHIDGNPQNNNISNLKIMTKSAHTKLHNPRDYSRYGVSAAENHQFWMKHYNKDKGINRIKVTEEIYKKVKGLLAMGVKQAKIAGIFNIDQSAVSRINTKSRYNMGYGWMVNKGGV